ncbi:MAG: peptide chain release factor 2 [Candidatus Magasanikbacteria bacterium]|nr:peptide chain release factor 2 [Candidatus Magasanikbacteria bacterium]
MKEHVEKLSLLKQKVQDTWVLLGLDTMLAEMHVLEKEMQVPEFWQDQIHAKAVGKRHEQLRSEVEEWQHLRAEVEELLDFCHQLESNPDEALAEDLSQRIGQLEKEFQKLEFFVLLNGKHDTKNAIVTIHSGSGGTEAQDWAEMLRRMIMRYAEKKGWGITILDESRGQEAGIKSSVLRIEGRYAYGLLKSEHGTHRLVRISPFDAESMRHTSFALIEVIPEVESDKEISIDPKELRIDTFMSGGAGGQSVNTTYSAVRIVHIPTGITVQCQNERSQLQNRETALKILHSKLQQIQEAKEEEEKQKLRGEYKSPEWGNQIRSYVLHPYKMVKDLRTKFESNQPEDILDGNLDAFVEAYLKWIKGA